MAGEIAIMKVNPFYDSWQSVLGRTADHGNTGPFVGVALSTENRLPARSGEDEHCRNLSPNGEAD